MRLTRPWHAGLAGSLAVALVGAPAGAGFAAYRHDAAIHGILPAGTTVGGVVVSGLDRATAVEAVRARFAPELARTATLRVAGREFAVTQQQAGVTFEIEAAVDRAFAEAGRGNWLSRAWRKLRQGGAAPAVPVAVSDPDEAALDRIVADVAAEVGVPAQDASVAESGGFLHFRHARTGLQLDTAAAAAALRRALADGSTQEAGLEQVTPRVPDTAFGTVILIRTGENKLYLYRDGRLDRTYGVATGSPKYPTPHGRFSVTLKRYRPTWVNPWSKWSMREPAFIPPGPNNPLGTRALNLSAPGIRIHGTPAARSIGYSVSHGCIRMRMPDVEALYPLVPAGTTVFIAYGGPPRFPSAAPPKAPADAADGG